MSNRLTRRAYLRSTAATAAAVTILPAGLARGYAANEKVNVGIIGAGGRGGANLQGVSDAGANIAALCDVDGGRLEQAKRRFPDAAGYTDFREMLTERKDLDAVVVSTPDNCHAPAGVMAMKQGLHCYCEKPLTRDVYEARLMAQLAAEKKLATQMGTPVPGSEGAIRTAELLRAGAIGDLVEVHLWSDRPIWPQGFDRPAGEDPVPENLHWDLFIGPAPMRPYKEKWPEGHAVYQAPAEVKRNGIVYHPFVWRGWWDFGTGVLGDIGAHAWNPIWMGMTPRAPSSVEVVDASGPVTEMFPAWSVVRFDFPALEGKPAWKFFWYDGTRFAGWRQPPADLLQGAAPGLSGTLIVGTKGILGRGHKSASDFQDVERTLPRPEVSAAEAMYQGWLQGIRTGSEPVCPFTYAGPLTEAVLLGNIALKVGRKIEWDPEAMRITNCEQANQYLKREYREGWQL